MAYEEAAMCLDCSDIFRMEQGGGFFHLFHCDKCGHIKSIGFDERGELYIRYFENNAGYFSAARVEHYQFVRRSPHEGPIGKEKFHKCIEALAGNCTCGGRFTFDTPFALP